MPSLLFSAGRLCSPKKGRPWPVALIEKASSWGWKAMGMAAVVSYVTSPVVLMKVPGAMEVVMKP